jgi:anti-sigma regulatory factor (Ser/Thr protein kinase)
MESLGCGPEARTNWSLVVSELVTNAVVHARSAPEVTATATDGDVHVDVYDGDRSPPVVREPAEGGTSGGFGLRIVDALSDRWGWEPTTAGKRVWAETIGGHAERSS